MKFIQDMEGLLTWLYDLQIISLFDYKWHSEYDYKIEKDIQYFQCVIHLNTTNIIKLRLDKSGRIYRLDGKLTGIGLYITDFLLDLYLN